MKTRIILAMLCAVTYSAAQTKICVQNGTKTEFYTDLDAAVQAAAARDTLYLPGGVYWSNSGELNIMKPIVIIGTGWDTDSLAILPTKITRDIHFKAGSDGSMITGCDIVTNSISIGDGDNVIQNITFWRNRMNQIIMDVEVKGVVFIENCITYLIHGNSASDCILSNNYINWVNELTTSTFSNNVIQSLTSNKNCTFTNNYIESFKKSGYRPSQACVFNNNAIALTLTEYGYDVNNSIETNTLFNQSVESVFEGTDLSVPSNLRIKADSPAKTAGTNGTEVGIFGGDRPFKLGSLPFNPQIRKADIKAKPDGKLYIDVKVEAQIR